MSAYAAFKAKNPPLRPRFASPVPQNSLLDAFVTHSSFSPRLDNAIYTSTSIFLGLQQHEYIVVEGVFELVVRRGEVLLNNIHKLVGGSSVPFVVGGSQSPPVISPTCKSLEDDGDEEKASGKDGKASGNGGKANGNALRGDMLSKTDLFPGFSTVVELRNLNSGILLLSQYCPALKAMYYAPASNYTFHMITEPQENVFAIHFDAQALKCINMLTRELCEPESAAAPVMVIGSKNCGKSTFGKTLKNNVVNFSAKCVAYMDLDPANSEYSVPGTISVTVHDSPTFGVHFPPTHSLQNDSDLYLYYGFDSAGTLPDHYLQCCKQLWHHYTLHLRPRGIPLIINTPGWVRGLGKDLLAEISELIRPGNIVYLTHNDAIEAGHFEADEFEAQDNPDDEVVSGLTYVNLSTLKATRIAPRVSSALVSLHNKLAYFHQRAPLEFHFESHLLSQAPVKLFYASNRQTLLVQIAGIFSLGHDLVFPLSAQDVLTFTEASIMALCLVPELSLPPETDLLGPKPPTDEHPRLFPLSAYPAADSTFVCLCMVHSVDVTQGFLNVYLPGDEKQLLDALQPYLEQKNRLVLVRGEGEVPLVELLAQGLEGPVLYVSTDAKMRIGGVWKPRRNLARKNQK